MGCRMYWASGASAEGAQSLNPDYWPGERNQQSVDQTVRLYCQQPPGNEFSHSDFWSTTWVVLMEIRSCTHIQRSPWAVGRFDMRCLSIWSGCLEFQDAMTHYTAIGSQSSQSSFQWQTRQWTEISKLSGHFRFLWNSIERPDCGTLDVDLLHIWELPWTTSDAPFCIQPFEHAGLGLNSAILLRGSNNRALTPTSSHTTLGRRFWRSQQGCHSRTKDWQHCAKQW